MRFPTYILLAITAFFTFLSTSTIHAQWVDFAPEACQSCLLKSRTAQFPACKRIPANPQSGHMSREARICQCRAASSNVWIASCTNHEACGPKTALILRGAYERVKPGCIQEGF